MAQLTSIDLFGGISMGEMGKILFCAALKFLAIATAIPKNFALHKTIFYPISIHQLPPNKSNMTIIRYILLFCFLVTSTLALSQEQEQSITPSLGGEVMVDPSKEVEIHRYMGYERLLPKYISLPYDVNTNTNIRGAFVDIGFLFLMFLPLILLIGIKDLKWKIVTMFLLSLFLLFSTTTGYCAYYKISIFEAQNHLQQVIQTISFSEAPLQFLKLKITQGLSAIYLPIDRLIAPITGEGDYVSLPLVLILFIGTILLISKQFQFTSINKTALAYFVLLHGFLWLLLSAGIPWYGILLLAVGLIVMAIYYFRLTKENEVYKKLFFGGAMLWLVFAFANRFADYKDGSNRLGAISTAPLIYGTGKYSDQQLMDLVYSNYNKALLEINEDPNVLVYRIGTFFHYFIDRNNERVFADNQLGFFDYLNNQYPDKQALTSLLKENNFKFLVLDLHTASIDATADQSLTKKYQKFTEFVGNNPSIQLLVTDRIIKNGNVEKTGSFAVFKII